MEVLLQQNRGSSLAQMIRWFGLTSQCCFSWFLQMQCQSYDIGAYTTSGHGIRNERFLSVFCVSSCGL